MAGEVLIEYTVADGMEDEADVVRAAFLEAVEQWEPERLTYRVLRRGAEGLSFVHLAWLDSKATRQRLFDTDFFKAFDVGMNRVSGGTITATPIFEWSP